MILIRILSTAVALLVASIAGAAAARGWVHTNTADVRDIDVEGDRVWVATGGGLAIHDRADGHFLYKITSEQGLGGTSQRAVMSLGEEGVLVGGDFGLSLVKAPRGVSQEPRVIRLAEWEEVYDPVFDLVFDGAEPVVVRFGSGPVPVELEKGLPAARMGGQGWVAGAWNGRRGVAAALDGTVSFFFHSEHGGRSKLAVNLEAPALALAPVGEGFVVATGRSLLFLDNSGLEPLDVRGAEGHSRPLAATTLAADGQGGVYVGTASGEIWRLEGRGLQRVLEACGGRITAIRADDGVLWLGLAHSGLHRFDLGEGALGPSLRPQGEICSNHVTHIVRHRGEIVVGTFDEGACRWDGSRWRRLDGLPSPYVLGLASDGRELWMGTSQGLVRFDGEFNPAPFGPKAPWLLREASKLATGSLNSPNSGRFVFSTSVGVVVAQKKKRGYVVDHFKWSQGVPGHRTAIEASDSAIYIGSEYRGVTQMTWSGKKTRVYLDPVHLPEAWVMDIDSAQGRGLWVGTCQEGVSLVRGDDALWFDKKSGLPDDRVIAVASWSDGAFVGTLGGLGFVRADGRARSFGTHAWLPDPRVSALAVLGEELWVGTEAGLVVHELSGVSAVVGE